MKYIKKITPQEMNDALKRYFDVATKEDFWEVKGLYATGNCLCYSTTDDNCFLCFDENTGFICYFAMKKDRMMNIKGLAEAVYEIVCSGHPFVKISGRNGRYPRILKSFGHYTIKETSLKEYEEIVWYAGHPDNIEKIKRRFN